MMNRSFWNGKYLLWFLGCIVFVVAFVVGYNSYRKSQQIVLFEGSYQICPRENPFYYPALDYNLSGYESYTSESIDRWGKNDDRNDSDTTIHSSTHTNKGDPALQLRLPTVYRDRRPYQSLQILYPENGSFFPPNLCEPYVKWEDPNNDLWLIHVEFGIKKESRSFVSKEKRWRFPASLWDQLRQETVTEDACLQIKGIRLDEEGERVGEIQASEVVHFRIAQEPADNYIVYRVVAPPFSSKKTPDIMMRDIRSDQEVCLLSARRQYCINCHTFSNKQGNQGKLGLQVRNLSAATSTGAKPKDLNMYIAVYDMDQRTGFKAQLPFVVQMSTFMAWSPDGSKLAFSANQKLATLSPVTFETQHAGTVTSDIAIYDIPKNETYLLPEASDPNWLENYPNWSPDGSTFVFARAPTGLHPAMVRYDLLAIQAGKDKAELIPGASNNSRSNYFPRFSPNGRWLSFCQCDGGDLIRSSSDIYLMDGDLRGSPRRLAFNVENAADSWHSWSANSRWLVFVSKREDGTFAGLYLSRIDDEGHASPAIPLPVEKEPLASFNIPEFIAHAPPARDQELFDIIRVEEPARQVREIDGRNAAPIVLP